MITPSSSPGLQDDIFSLDPADGSKAPVLRTGLLASSIAVTRDGRLLSVDFDRMGVLADRIPKLRVFDLKSGKRIKELEGKGTGVRYSVCVSRDGHRAIAFIGKLKINFNCSDMVGYDVPVDETLSVWDLTSYRGVVSSQNIPGLRNSSLRTGAKGRMRFLITPWGTGRHHAYVYKLP